MHWALLDQGVIPAGQPFSLYLKAKSKLYTVTQINTLPTINTALSVVAALAAGLYADRTGQFWVPSIFASLGVLIGCILLAVWNIGETGRVAAFIITGTNGGTFRSSSSLSRSVHIGDFLDLTWNTVLSPMTMSWATTLMSTDAEERAIVTASMNAIGQAISAWSQLLEYPAIDAPNFHKGFIVTIGAAVLQLLNLSVIWFLSRRELRQRQRTAEVEDSDTNTEPKF